MKLEFQSKITKDDKVYLSSDNLELKSRLFIDIQRNGKIVRQEIKFNSYTENFAKWMVNDLFGNTRENTTVVSAITDNPGMTIKDITGANVSWARTKKLHCWFGGDGSKGVAFPENTLDQLGVLIGTGISANQNNMVSVIPHNDTTGIAYGTESTFYNTSQGVFGENVINTDGVNCIECNRDFENKSLLPITIKEIGVVGLVYADGSATSTKVLIVRDKTQDIIIGASEKFRISYQLFLHSAEEIVDYNNHANEFTIIPTTTVNINAFLNHNFGHIIQKRLRKTDNTAGNIIINTNGNLSPENPSYDYLSLVQDTCVHINADTSYGLVLRKSSYNKGSVSIPSNDILLLDKYDERVKSYVFENGLLKITLEATFQAPSVFTTETANVISLIAATSGTLQRILVASAKAGGIIINKNDRVKVEFTLNFKAS